MKKLIGLFLSLVMVSSMFALTAFAADKTYEVSGGNAVIVNPADTLPAGCDISQICGFRIKATMSKQGVKEGGPSMNYLMVYSFRVMAKASYKNDLASLWCFYNNNDEFMETISAITQAGKTSVIFASVGDTQTFEHKGSKPLFATSKKMSFIEGTDNGSSFTFSDIKWLDKDGNELTGTAAAAPGGDTQAQPGTSASTGNNPATNSKTSSAASTDASVASDESSTEESTDSTISEGSTAELTSSATSELASTTQASGKESKNNGKVVAIVVIVAVVIIGAGVASFFIIRKKKGSAE